jgi:hypothetical protein
MSNTWTFKDDIGAEPGAVVGYEVEAKDGKIGKIDVASHDADNAHLVVDTGWWIFGKKRLIPAGVATGIDSQSETVQVNLTKEQVKNAPDWHDTHGPGGADDWHQPYDAYFGPMSGSTR